VIFFRLYLTFLAPFVLLAACTVSSQREETLVAVATNFAETGRRLEADFEAMTGYDVTLTTGSTGHIYAQIRNGAPFDLFLSADQARPQRLEQAGQAVAGSGFTYAIGLLVLWADDGSSIGMETLKKDQFRRLAMANPDVAPYGRAAYETIEVLGLESVLAPKIVMGENVGQTYGLVATGNADLGFVAQSTVLSSDRHAEGSYWVVPQDFYMPIRQDAVLLTRAQDNEAAKAFMAYLKSEKAKAVMRHYGYRQP